MFKAYLFSPEIREEEEEQGIDFQATDQHQEAKKVFTAISNKRVIVHRSYFSQAGTDIAQAGGNRCYAGNQVDIQATQANGSQGQKHYIEKEKLQDID